jgi:hypothetical protein
MELLASIFGRGKNVTLTADEKSLCEIIEYDQRLALNKKRVTKNKIELRPEVDEYAEIQTTRDEGLCSKVEYRKAFDYVMKNKDKFSRKRYLLFFFKGNSDDVYLSMIKGTNETDIVTWRQTSALNFSLVTENIVEKLLDWQKLCDYHILGAGDDYIEMRFLELPKDIDAFVADLYQFCPDIVENANEIGYFKEELIKTRMLSLWWD